jgi:hypothetical protein
LLFAKKLSQKHAKMEKEMAVTLNSIGSSLNAVNTFTLYLHSPLLETNSVTDADNSLQSSTVAQSTGTTYGLLKLCTLLPPDSTSLSKMHSTLRRTSNS